MRAALTAARSGADFADALVVQIDLSEGCTEVRTFDLKTLQPAGRLTFSSTP